MDVILRVAAETVLGNFIPRSIEVAFNTYQGRMFLNEWEAS